MLSLTMNVICSTTFNTRNCFTSQEIPGKASTRPVCYRHEGRFIDALCNGEMLTGWFHAEGGATLDVLQKLAYLSPSLIC